LRHTSRNTVHREASNIEPGWEEKVDCNHGEITYHILLCASAEKNLSTLAKKMSGFSGVTVSSRRSPRQPSLYCTTTVKLTVVAVPLAVTMSGTV
jgi:hypothetical protein